MNFIPKPSEHKSSYFFLFVTVMGNGLRSSSRENETINNNCQLTDDEDESAYSPKHSDNQSPTENIGIQATTKTETNIDSAFGFSHLYQLAACDDDQVN